MRAGNALLGGVFELHHRLVGPALAQRLRAGAERLLRTAAWLTAAAR